MKISFGGTRSLSQFAKGTHESLNRNFLLKFNIRTMKQNILLKVFFIAALFMVYSINAKAQCGAGYTRDTLNWDYLDFIPNSGAYVTPTAFVSLAQCQTQKFAFGTQTLTITHNYSGSSVVGDDATCTAETGTYGRGADLRMKGNGTITFTFQNAVQGVKFSIADIDKNQQINVSALNSLIGTNVTATTLSGSILTVTNNNTSNVTIAANSTLVNPTDNAPTANGTVNIDITGPVTAFTLSVTSTGTGGGSPGEDGSYWVSDISACSAGTFPIDYYSAAKPFTGQPSYFLAVRNNNVYYVNVNTGAARLLFVDNGHTNINSLAYDPYRHMVYYSYSLSSTPTSDKTIRRYDYDMDTLGIFISNVNTLGIPTFESGVESGAAAFYNNSYYLGIEGTNMGDDKSGRESIVWRVDFSPTYSASSIAQVYAVPADNGSGTGLHDWGDIGINNGILYDFDGAAGQTDFYHKNLLTGECVNIAPNPSGLVPRQVSVDWTGQMYNSGSPSSSAAGTVVPYNGDGTVDNSRLYTMKYNGVAVTGSWGDAGEAFKPKTDFGDAPASYDPALIDPGTHERNDSIYLGATKPGIEWSKHTSADATGDGSEEDGITGLPVITTGVSNFTVSVKVYNNTGRNATLVGWVDANGNGKYDAAEGTTLNITSSASVQTVTLLWSGINTTLPAFSTTFLRLRIATADQGLTTSTPNGYMDNGEIEDFTVTVSLLLPDQNITLKAQKVNTDKVNLVWNLNQESNNASYELQRSNDGAGWETIATKTTVGGSSAASYTHLDQHPTLPVSWYRVKVNKNSGALAYSDIRKIDFKQLNAISVSPNPAKSSAVLKVETGFTGIIHINMLDYTGRIVYDADEKVTNGTNEIDLPLISRLSNGMYKIRVKIENEIFVTTLMIVK